MIQIFNTKFRSAALLIILVLLTLNTFGQSSGGNSCDPPQKGPQIPHSPDDPNTKGPQDPADPVDPNNSGDPTWPIDVTVPGDPNEMISPDGFDSAHWVSVKENMGFTVLFENDPKIATAPAHDVYIFCPVNEHQDMSTFLLGDFGFNEDVFSVPANTSYYTTRLDLRDSLGLFVDVTAGMDVVNNRAFWIFEAIDPATGLTPVSPEMGFLPVRDSSITGFSDTIAVKGEGFVSFTMKPKALAHTRDTILATAQIVFDTNDTIATNTEFNTIDAVAPVSHITATPVINHVTTLHITATDDNNGCGVKNYDLYVAQDSSNYALYLSNSTDSVIQFTGINASKYYFFTLAQDNVGNREILKSDYDVMVDMSTSGSLWYADADTDGYGNPLMDSIALHHPTGYVTNNTDCDDNNSNINSTVQFFVDADVDGFGSAITQQVCALTPPTGFATTNTDCNDFNGDVHPGVPEVCNGIDDNCNNVVDEGCTLTLNLRAFIEGFYLGNNAMNPVLFNTGLNNNLSMSDTIRIELHDPFNLSTILSSNVAVIDVNGYATAHFAPELDGITAYIVVFHRSSIETWSKLPVTIGEMTTYDFTH